MDFIGACSVDIAHPREVKPVTLERCRVPQGEPFDVNGAAKTAAEIIKTLDRHYSREQVHAVSIWMKYLSTQA